MKLNKLLLLIVPMLLTSCEGGPIIKGDHQKEVLSLEAAIERVEQVPDLMPVSYTVSGEAHVGGIPCDLDHGTLIENKSFEYKETILTTNPLDSNAKWGITENLTNDKNFNKNSVSSSHFLGAPLRLKSYPFYKEKVDSKGVSSLDINQCVFGYFKGVLIYVDSTSTIKMFINDAEQLVIGVYNSFTFLTIYNINYNVANYSGRINAEFKYDLDTGLLKTDKVWSNKYNGHNADEASILYIESTYDYTL